MSPSAPGTKRPLPLMGVKVLDVSQVMAGPYSCMLLADMGADVIKVEPPGSGDQTRGAMGFKMKGPDSMGFLNMNRNKRSIAINLKSEAGKAILFKLSTIFAFSSTLMYLLSDNFYFYTVKNIIYLISI